jgi:hypothetical protein
MWGLSARRPRALFPLGGARGPIRSFRRGDLAGASGPSFAFIWAGPPSAEVAGQR